MEVVKARAVRAYLRCICLHLPTLGPGAVTDHFPIPCETAASWGLSGVKTPADRRGAVRI